MTVTSSLIQSNVDLAPYNTLNIHANARHFVKVKTEKELVSVLNDPRWNQTNKFILGGGSNVLFVNDFEGLVIHVAIEGKKMIRENDDYVWLKVGAGENWHQTVLFCVKKGWGGIENLSLIPGTVGAAPIQNIGAYGVELKDCFEQLTAVNIKTAARHIFNYQECNFGYRDSIFKNECKGQFAVTDVSLKLAKKPKLNTGYGAIQKKMEEKHIRKPTIREISDIVIEIRNSKLPDPSEIANAGSFFKNPVIETQEYETLKDSFPSIPGYKVNGHHTKVPAGWLIEQAGWKGREVGHTGTYRQQALVIINHGGADGREILSLARKIQHAVRKMFEIELVPEVNIVE